METEQSFTPVDRRKVYEQVAEQLLAQIGARHLTPGDPLPSERELTESFGVGRSSPSGRRRQQRLRSRRGGSSTGS